MVKTGGVDAVASGAALRKIKTVALATNVSVLMGPSTKSQFKAMILTVVSGGQTGVDRAALDVALKLGIPCGGWCPKGRIAEDGVLPTHYPLVETLSSEYTQRTEWNVRDSDATLILYRGYLSGGTAFTVEQAPHYQKPLLQVNLVKLTNPSAVRGWIQGNQGHVLNVAGPRESSTPGIYLEAARFLKKVLSPTDEKVKQK